MDGDIYLDDDISGHSKRTLDQSLFIYWQMTLYFYHIMSHLIVFFSHPSVIDRTKREGMHLKVIQTRDPELHISATLEAFISEQVFHLLLEVFLSAEITSVPGL